MFCWLNLRAKWKSHFWWFLRDGPVFYISTDRGHIFQKFHQNFVCHTCWNPSEHSRTDFSVKMWHSYVEKHFERGYTLRVGRFFWPFLALISTLHHSGGVSYFFIRFFALVHESLVPNGLFHIIINRFEWNSLKKLSYQSWLPFLGPILNLVLTVK